MHLLSPYSTSLRAGLPAQVGVLVSSEINTFGTRPEPQHPKPLLMIA